MKKNFGAFGARQFSLETLVGGRPGTAIFQNPAGGRRGAGGCRIQGPGPAAPPGPPRPRPHRNPHPLMSAPTPPPPQWAHAGTAAPRNRFELPQTDPSGTPRPRGRWCRWRVWHTIWHRWHRRDLQPRCCRAPSASSRWGERHAQHWGGGGHEVTPPPPCDIPSRCCFFTGPWTVARSSLRMLRRGAAFCRPLRPVLLLVSFPRSRSPVVGVLGLCGMWRDVPFARQRRPIIGVLGVVLVAPPPPKWAVRPRTIGRPPHGRCGRRPFKPVPNAASRSPLLGSSHCVGGSSGPALHPLARPPLHTADVRAFARDPSPGVCRPKTALPPPTFQRSSPERQRSTIS